MSNHDDSQRKRNQVASALNGFNPAFKPQAFTETELILQKAQDVAKAVSVITREIDAAARAAGTPHDVKSLAAIISKTLKDGFMEFDYDELLFLIVAIHTDCAIDAITGSTEGPKIIQPI